MGICIEAQDSCSFPLGVIVTLECDAEFKEMFCRGFEIFDHRDGFIGAHGMAMKAGWLERQTSQGRKWICPTCSGKRGEQCTSVDAATVKRKRKSGATTRG